MFTGWSLLLGHGEKHRIPYELMEDKTIFVTLNKKDLPDAVLDIYRIKCRKCLIFDRIYLPSEISTKTRLRISLLPVYADGFRYILENIVKKVLKVGGEFIVPSDLMVRVIHNINPVDLSLRPFLKSNDVPTPDEHTLIVGLIKKHGFENKTSYDVIKRGGKYKFKKIKNHR